MVSANLASSNWSLVCTSFPQRIPFCIRCMRKLCSQIVHTSETILNSRQIPSRISLQRNDHFKQHGFSDLSVWITDERTYAAYCHTCLKALQSGMLTSSNAVPAFTKNGFSNWKNSMGKKKGFQKHESSDSHVETVSNLVLKTLLKDRTDASARILQRKTTEIQIIEDPKLPRKKKVSVRHELENRTLTTHLKLPKTITDDYSLMR